MRIKATLEYRGVKRLISRKGQAVTLMRLEDEEGDQVTVWTPHEPLGLRKGQQVDVVLDIRELQGSAEVIDGGLDGVGA